MPEFTRNSLTAKLQFNRYTNHVKNALIAVKAVRGIQHAMQHGTAKEKYQAWCRAGRVAFALQPRLIIHRDFIVTLNQQRRLLYTAIRESDFVFKHYMLTLNERYTESDYRLDRRLKGERIIMIKNGTWGD